MLEVSDLKSKCASKSGGERLKLQIGYWLDPLKASAELSIEAPLGFSLPESFWCLDVRQTASLCSPSSILIPSAHLAFGC